VWWVPEVPISVKVRVPTGRLLAFEGSPPLGVLEVLRGSLPEKVSAVLSVKWMNTSEDIIYSQLPQ